MALSTAPGSWVWGAGMEGGTGAGGRKGMKAGLSGPILLA